MCFLFCINVDDISDFVSVFCNCSHWYRGIIKVITYLYLMFAGSNFIFERVLISLIKIMILYIKFLDSSYELPVFILIICMLI